MPETEKILCKENRYLRTEHLKRDLTGRSVRGGMVTIAAHVSSFAIRVGSTMILARMLSPRDYGLVAMVTAITSFIEMFRDLGLSSATIQSESLNHEQVSALFWINSLVGAAFAICMVLLGPALVWFYKEPRLYAICSALGISFLFSGLAAQPLAILKRQMRFAALSTIQVIATSLGVSVAISLAYFGSEYWALVSMQIAVAAGTAVGAWIATIGWHPKAVIRTAGIKRLLRFGANLSSVNVLNYFVRNLDNVLIGRYWGPQNLGLYAKAYELLLLPIQLINYPVGQVTIPALSRLKHEDDQYRQYYCNVLKFVAFISFPLIALLVANSKEIVEIVLGDKWVEVTPIFQIFAIAAFPQQIMTTTGWIYVSLGQADRMFRLSALIVPLLVLAFIVGLKWGALGVAYAFAVWTYLVFMPSMWYATRLSPITLQAIWMAVHVPAAVGIMLYLGMTAMRHIWITGNMLIDIALSILGGLVLCVAGIAVWPRARAEIISLRKFLVYFKFWEKADNRS